MGYHLLSWVRFLWGTFLREIPSDSPTAIPPDGAHSFDRRALPSTCMLRMQLKGSCLYCGHDLIQIGRAADLLKTDDIVETPRRPNEL